MKSVLVTSFDMELGGVERSLSAMLSNFDYTQFEVDVHLHSHSGPLLNLLPNEANLLEEIPTCTTYRKSIKSCLTDGFYIIAFKRLLAKFAANIFRIKNSYESSGYVQMQMIWDRCITNTARISRHYDVAISYLWPHHFTAFNVNARTKIAWIHTDYSTINVMQEKDLKVWHQFDAIVSISEASKQAFITTYPSLRDKVTVVENITNPDYVKKMSNESEDLPFSSDDFNLLSVGRLCEAKAFDRAVEVLNYIHSKGYKQIKWFIVGDGSDKTLIENKINKFNLQDSFILLGSTSNPYPFMKGCDLYIQPSRYEGKAVTVTEAQILAKPVLITNYATSDSQIKHREDGYICEQSVQSIGDAIIKLYENDMMRKQVIDYCSSTSFVNSKELEKLYELFPVK